MEYKVIGKIVPVVELTMKKNEKVYTQRGGMTYQTSGFSMNTNARGGILKSLGRVFAGESIFMVTYEALNDDERIAFGSTVPGDVMPIALKDYPNGIMLQKGAFLCATDDVTTKVEFTKRLSSGFFGGEGFILQKASGVGQLFLEVDGDPILVDLKDGEVLKVNTGNLVAFDPSVKYEIEMVRGLGNIFLGGEGLFLTKLIGPGKVILQSQNFNDFKNRVAPNQKYSNNDNKNEN